MARLMIIDGPSAAARDHAGIASTSRCWCLYVQPKGRWPTRFLLTLDPPCAAMAESDAERSEALLTTAASDSAALAGVIESANRPEHQAVAILPSRNVRGARVVALTARTSLRTKWGT